MQRLLKDKIKSCVFYNDFDYVKRNKVKFVTFSGNCLDNPLKKLNDQGINFWIDSKAYNYIEGMHLLLLMSINDHIIGKSIYKS